MKFKWKLLILLMCVAVVPVAFARFFGVRAVRSLSADLSTLISKEHLDRTERRLQTLVSGYSKVLQTDRERMELYLEYRSSTVERALSDPPGKSVAIYFVDDFKEDRNPPEDIAYSERYAREGKSGGGHLLKVSFGNPVFRLEEGVSETSLAEDLQRLAGNLAAQKNARAFRQNDILWMMIVLENGLTAVYPGTGSIPVGLDFRKQEWYRNAMDDNRIQWSQRFIDPFTRQTVVAVSQPIYRSDNTFLGIVSFIVPVSRFLEYDFLVGNLPEETKAFMCRLESDPESKTPGIRILAREEDTKTMTRSWRTQVEEDWLFTESSPGYTKIRQGLESGSGGSLLFPYADQDSLYIYSPLNNLNGFLLLITPFEKIMEPVLRVEKHIDGMITKMLTFTGFAVIGMSLVVFALAYAFSLTVSRPLQALLDASLRLAQGDFNVRADITSQDEFGDLGRVFNRVGPMLAEHGRMSQSLALASEVQRNLLPQKDPEIVGLDISGASVSCDETGGDYYDYIITPEEKERIRVAVGDVSGHGIPSTLLMTTARAFLRQRASIPGDPSAIVTDVNIELSRDVESSGRFMTLFFCEINTADRTLRWVRAGHDPALLYDPETDVFEELGGKGIPIGIFGNSDYPDYAKPISAGQLIILGTDGIWECMDPSGNMFGKKRFQNLIRTHADKPARRIVETVIAEVDQFRDGAEQDDDVTVVIIKVQPTA